MLPTASKWGVSGIPGDSAHADWTEPGTNHAIGAN